jgi:hypothetical protein
MREKLPTATGANNDNVYDLDQYRERHASSKPAPEYPVAREGLASVSLLRISDQRFILDARSSTPRYRADLTPEKDEKLGAHLYKGYAENTSNIRRDEELNYLQHLGASLLTNGTDWAETKRILSAGQKHMSAPTPQPVTPPPKTIIKKGTSADHLFVIDDETHTK